LLSATPQANTDRKRKRIKLTGELPSPLNPPSGCSFHPRCQHAVAQCKTTTPVMEQHGDVRVACLLVK
jgi:dipeptide transport system ATP-binding protein